MSVLDTVFGGYTSADLVWGHDLGDHDHADAWHIVGPRMPRVSPVSPTYITPCGYTLAADAMHDRIVPAPVASPAVPICRFCATFAEQLAHAERDATRSRRTS